MADNRSRLTKLLGMLGSDYDGERANAAKMIADMAKAQKISIADLCMSGTERVVIQERVVYRDRPQPENRGFGGFSFEEMAREAERQQKWKAEQRAGARQERERAEEQARADRQARYGGAFDDAEMTDEQREALRAERARRRANRARLRALLDELTWAYDNRVDGDLNNYEIEFASTIPNQYESDDQLTRRQVETARKIIAKAKRNMGESPI